MTPELETLLRDTLAQNARSMEDRELIAPVRRRAARRGQLRIAASGAAVVVVLAGLGTMLHTVRQDEPSPKPLAAATVPSDWRAESTDGVQIRVPAHWTTGNLGCGMDQKPTVKKEGGFERACGWHESATKEAAIFGQGVNWPNRGIASFPNSPEAPDGTAAERKTITVSGRPALRTEFRLPDGRYAGWVHPEGNILVTVRTLSAEKTKLILDSVELITVDASGCPVDQPKAARPTPPKESGTWFAPPKTSSVALCSYGEFGWRLRDSAVATDGALVSALNQGRAGYNPDCDPSTTSSTSVAKPEMVLYFRDANNSTLATAYLRLAGCTERGFDNGRSRMRANSNLINLATSNTIGGPAFHEDLIRNN